jgi:predicted transcriptional regulator
MVEKTLTRPNGGRKTMMKSLTEMTAEIAVAQASHSVMSAEDMEGFLKKTFQALNEFKTAEEGMEPQPVIPPSSEVMAPEKSIQKNKIICLECGREFKLLSNRHLVKEHDMDAKEYRKKYGFSARQPLAARSLSAKRRATAKIHNLGEKLQQKRREKTAAGEVQEKTVEPKVKRENKGGKRPRAKKDQK